jgi:PAS domain S-box-containing protein
LPAFRRYQELQQYVNWTAEDAARVKSIGPLVTSFFHPLVDDFYDQIKRHADALKVITGGEEQIARLKKTLVHWLEELFSGCYDHDYVDRRWRVGFRHVEIGLDQVYTNAALSRLRSGLLAAVARSWPGDTKELLLVRESLNKLLDLDLAIIEDAYQTEFQRRQAEAERLAREEEYRSLFESTLDGLIVLNDEASIVAINVAACSIFHLTCAELLDKRLDFLILKVNHGNRPAQWDDFFKDDKDRGEYSLLRLDGTFVDVEYRSVATFSAHRHLISLRDVSDRKRAEERARQSSRLAAIGETMAALVHESRNALQRSKANLEMLSLEVEDRPEAQKLVQRVEKAQEDLHKLFEEVRQWAAPLNLRREPCNLRQLWREVWTNVVHLQPVKKPQLDEKSPEAVTVSVDRFAMAQVFRNVFENAVEVSPAGEAVEIGCCEQSAGKDGSILITITDRGPGLSAEQQQRIFERRRPKAPASAWRLLRGLSNLMAEQLPHRLLAARGLRSCCLETTHDKRTSNFRC